MPYRDLKPENIFIMKKRKCQNWGLRAFKVNRRRWASSIITIESLSGQLIKGGKFGTPCFAPPEMHLRKDHNRKVRTIWLGYKASFRLIFGVLESCCTAWVSRWPYLLTLLSLAPECRYPRVFRLSHAHRDCFASRSPPLAVLSPFDLIASLFHLLYILFTSCFPLPPLLT